MTTKKPENNEWRFVGDGKDMVFIIPGEGCYLLKNAVITNFDTTISAEQGVMRSMLGDHISGTGLMSPVQKEVNITVIPQDIQAIADMNSLNLDFSEFDTRTVKQILEDLEKKILERGK